MDRDDGGALVALSVRGEKTMDVVDFAASKPYEVTPHFVSYRNSLP